MIEWLSGYPQARPPPPVSSAAKATFAHLSTLLNAAPASALSCAAVGLIATPPFFNAAASTESAFTLSKLESAIALLSGQEILRCRRQELNERNILSILAMQISKEKF